MKRVPFWPTYLILTLTLTDTCQWRQKYVPKHLPFKLDTDYSRFTNQLFTEWLRPLVECGLRVAYIGLGFGFGLGFWLGLWFGLRFCQHSHA